VNPSQLRALGRTIELCGWDAASRVVTDPDPLRRNHWLWEIGDDGIWFPAYSGTLAWCNELDRAYRNRFTSNQGA
jgi:hypothetical protein